MWREYKQLCEHYFPNHFIHIKEEDFIKIIDEKIIIDYDMLFKSYLKYLNALDDIGLILLKSKSDIVLSDNPVLKINAYLKDININGDKTCLDAKGLMIFMPISPKYIICLYDKKTIKITSINLDENDISNFNFLQIKNASEFYIKSINSLSIHGSFNFFKVRSSAKNIKIEEKIPLRKNFCLNPNNVILDYNLIQTHYR